MAFRDNFHRATVLCQRTATMQTRKLTSNRCSFLAHRLKPIKELHHLSHALLHRKDGLVWLSSACLCGQSTQIDHMLLS